MTELETAAFIMAERIEKDFKAGAITADQYELLKEDLERRLILAAVKDCFKDDPYKGLTEQEIEIKKFMHEIFKK